MKRPWWFRLARVLLGELRDGLHNPMIAIPIGYGIAVAHVAWTLSSLSPVVDASWVRTITEVVSACNGVGL